ncbi:MAG: hypothetical protein MJE77_36380 [Proteobacteria bacterium]|nr:hypothetical protein [Pseudomonadota bacterium]
MDARRAMELLLEMSRNPDFGPEQLDAYFGDAGIELLTALCSSLTWAAAAAGGKSPSKTRANQLAVECIAGIHIVLDVWTIANIEIVDGPHLTHSWLGEAFFD